MDYYIQSQELPAKIIFFIVVVALSVALTYFYRQFATQREIIAKINSRTLHDIVVPRGGGIGFGFLFSLIIFGLWIMDDCPTWLMLSIGLGSFVAALVGFIDDVYEITALKKLMSHFCLSLYFSFVFFSYHPFPLSIYTDLFLFGLIMGIWLFIPLWAINLLNFIDGIDGLAISASVFTCMAMVIVLFLTEGDPVLITVFSILAAASIGFVFFNMPPASIFMGDSGSIFLGYFVGCSILITIYLGEISMWTWITALSYYLADTTTTTISRMFLVKKWYGEHRSHAYQNLARIKNNHAKVMYWILLYQVFWALPLVIWSALDPDWAPAAAIIALTPAVLWSLNFGPRLSSQ